MEGDRREQQLLYVPRCNLVHGAEVAPTRRVVRVLLVWCMMQRRPTLGRPAVVAMEAHTPPLSPLSNNFSSLCLPFLLGCSPMAGRVPAAGRRAARGVGRHGNGNVDESDA
jgi:hypothetical protein